MIFTHFTAGTTQLFMSVSIVRRMIKWININFATTQSKPPSFTFVIVNFATLRSHLNLLITRTTSHHFDVLTLTDDRATTKTIKSQPERFIRFPKRERSWLKNVLIVRNSLRFFTQSLQAREKRRRVEFCLLGKIVYKPHISCFRCSNLEDLCVFTFVYYYFDLKILNSQIFFRNLL